MAGMVQRQLPALLALGALLAGCAHAPPAAQVPTDGASAAATASKSVDEAATAGPQHSKKPVRVMVTGSRLPYYVQPGSNALPTYSEVRVYTRDELLSTGRDGDLGGALQALDPSITHR